MTDVAATHTPLNLGTRQLPTGLADAAAQIYADTARTGYHSDNPDPGHIHHTALTAAAEWAYRTGEERNAAVHGDGEYTTAFNEGAEDAAAEMLRLHLLGWHRDLGALNHTADQARAAHRRSHATGDPAAHSHEPGNVSWDSGMAEKTITDAGANLAEGEEEELLRQLAAAVAAIADLAAGND